MTMQASWGAAGSGMYARQEPWQDLKHLHDA